MALNTTNTPELPAEAVQKLLVQPLEQTSQFLAAGPRIFDSANQVRIPKMGGPTTPAWHAENEQITEQDPTFDEVVLLPSTMKSVKVLTRFSNELARQSVVSLDAALKDRLVRDVATALDKQFFGYGGDGIVTPKGILAYAGQTIDKTDTALALDDIHDAWGLALGANVNMTGLKWVMRPETFTALRKLKDSSNRYQLQPDPTQDGVFRLLGAPVIVTSNLPLGPDAADVDTDADEKNVVLADFSQIAVARDLAPSVKILDQTFGDYDQQAIRVVARYDAAPLNANAVIRIKNIA